MQRLGQDSLASHYVEERHSLVCIPLSWHIKQSSGTDLSLQNTESPEKMGDGEKI